MRKKESDFEKNAININKALQKERRKAQGEKALNGLKRGVLKVVLVPYRMVKFAKKKVLLVANLLTQKGKERLLLVQEKDELLAMFDKTKIGKREKTIRKDYETSKIEGGSESQTTLYTANGPMRKTVSTHYKDAVNPYYDSNYHQETTTILGYMQIKDNKDKDVYAYVVAEYKEKSCDGALYSESYNVKYSTDGKTFTELTRGVQDSHGAAWYGKEKGIYSKLNNMYEEEYKNSTEISQEAETTK